MKTLIVASCLACGVLVAPVAVFADTSAPNLQLQVLQCEGASVTVVSPVEPARAAQIVGATGVGVLQQVLFVGPEGPQVLFEQPSARHLRASALTSCSLELPGFTLTLTVFFTPQRPEH